jgi:hypothetical protein
MVRLPLYATGAVRILPLSRFRSKKCLLSLSAGYGDLRGCNRVQGTWGWSRARNLSRAHNEINAGLSVEKPFVNVSAVAELLLYLELAASALKETRQIPGTSTLTWH